MRFRGFISPPQAAERLHVCARTALAWAHRSLNAEDDDDVIFPGVERTAAGRLLIPIESVEKLRPHKRR